VGTWDGVARVRDDGAVKGDAVGLVDGHGVEGVLAQVLASSVGVEVALEVSVVAVGDGVGVEVLGACELAMVLRAGVTSSACARCWWVR
jgi:hypothetical protein